MKERIMPCSVGGAAMPKQPWHPLLIFLPQGGGGRSMAHGGRFVAEMNEEATDGRPCQPTGGTSRPNNLNIFELREPFVLLT